MTERCPACLHDDAVRDGWCRRCSWNWANAQPVAGLVSRWDMAGFVVLGVALAVLCGHVVGLWDAT